MAFLKKGFVYHGNAGNWLRIEIGSSISAFSEESNVWSLNSYPAVFLGYEGYATTVIVPKQASEATLNSGYQLAAFYPNMVTQMYRLSVKMLLIR